MTLSRSAVVRALRRGDVVRAVGQTVSREDVVRAARQCHVETWSEQ